MGNAEIAFYSALSVSSEELIYSLRCWPTGRRWVWVVALPGTTPSPTSACRQKLDRDRQEVQDFYDGIEPTRTSPVRRP